MLKPYPNLLYDQHEATREGWLLSQRDDGFWEVQKYDNLKGWRYDRSFQQHMPPFETDDEALAYVQRQSFSLMHAEAAALHDQPWRDNAKRREANG